MGSLRFTFVALLKVCDTSSVRSASSDTGSRDGSGTNNDGLIVCDDDDDNDDGDDEQ